MSVCTCCGLPCPGNGEFIRGHAPRLKGKLRRFDLGVDRTPIMVWNPETAESYALSSLADVIDFLQRRGWRDSPGDRARFIRQAEKKQDREAKKVRVATIAKSGGRIQLIERMKLAARLVKESGVYQEVTADNCESIIQQLVRE